MTTLNVFKKMHPKTTLQLLILISSLFIINTAVTSADDDIVINLSPIIIVDSAQSQNGEKKLLMQHQSNLKSLQPIPKDLNSQNSLHQLDNYSLTLGANLNINDNFNIGAACGMPLINSEPIQMEDLSIEAMVTMQF
jgi:hypothetical protein